MRFFVVRALLAAVLAVPARAVQVEIVPAEVPVSAPAASAGAGPAAVALNVPALTAAPVLAPSALEAVPGVVAPAPTLAPALAAPAALPAAPGIALHPQAAPAFLEQGPVESMSAAPRRAASTRDDGAEGAAASGRELFDAAATPRSRTVWSRVRSWLPGGERLPAWPGRAGEKVRLDGRTYQLDRPLGEGDGPRAWTAVQGDYVVELARPQDAPKLAAEKAAARALDGTDVPHAGLVAASADGTVLVRERLEGWDAPRLLREGFSRSQQEGWAELAARMIRAGVGADLSPSNLIWRHWRSLWTLRSAVGAGPARPGAVLQGLLTPQARAAGVEPGEFLAGVRGRLGPDSADWARTREDLRSDPRLAPALRALEARDAAAPPAPKIVFEAAPEPARFADRVATPKEIARAAGYDPTTAAPRLELHADDPGKLNTHVVSVQPKGKTPVVMKTAGWDIVRNELAIRRVVRRFFGAYFDVPDAYGVDRGLDSYLVMEKSPGSKAWSHPPLTRGQRTALAILARAFGLGDMNPGNLLFGDGKPVLLDFEQALSRSGPVVGRLPDERIAEEMPWMARNEMNRVEDFQPAVRAWRALLAEPATREALVSDFEAAGFTRPEAEAKLAVVEANSAALDWTLQNDVDFVNQFAERHAARAP
jgi:hypothetical protein